MVLQKLLAWGSQQALQLVPSLRLWPAAVWHGTLTAGRLLVQEMVARGWPGAAEAVAGTESTRDAPTASNARSSSAAAAPK